MLTCCGVARPSSISTPSRQFSNCAFRDFSDHFSQLFLLQLKAADRPVELHALLAVAQGGIVAIHGCAQRCPRQCRTGLCSGNLTALSFLLHSVKYFPSAPAHCQTPIRR
jgi:hypothetical protein